MGFELPCVSLHGHQSDLPGSRRSWSEASEVRAPVESWHTVDLWLGRDRTTHMWQVEVKELLLVLCLRQVVSAKVGSDTGKSSKLR